jgi:hypothetical protein
VVGWLLAGGAAAYFAASTRAGITDAMPRRQLVAAVALLMAILFVVQLNVTGSAAFAVGTFCLLGLAAGVRTPASSGLGLEQLPDHPGAMMAARTAATQLGYLLGAVIGGGRDSGHRLRHARHRAGGGYGRFGMAGSPCRRPARGSDAPSWSNRSSGRAAQ